MLKQNYESIIPSIKAVSMGQNVYGNEIITKLPGLIGKSNVVKALDQYGLSERNMKSLKKLQMDSPTKKYPKHFFLAKVPSAIISARSWKN